MTCPYPYPPIPADCVDSIKPGLPPPREINLVTSQPFPLLSQSDWQVRCMCKGTRSDKWGPREVAAAVALHETSVDLENERLIRTHHRSLGACPFVYETTEENGNQIWVVSVGPSVPIYDTHAAGRAIHIHPEFLLPELSQAYSGTRKDPLRRRINPRRFLPAHELELLRRFFPAAIGVRVLISGFLVVLFRNQKDIDASWLEGCVHSFGKLRLGYDVAVHYPTETVAESGNAVSDGVNGSATPLGLKLRFLDDSEGVTVPTHAFVDIQTPQEKLARKQASCWSKLRAALSKGTVVKLKEYIKDGSRVTSPLGKSVWFVQEPKEKVGTLSETFDNHVVPSATFPQTINFDTSIVTGDELPRVLNPPRAPKIVGWGEYCEALDGHSVFAMALNTLPSQSGRNKHEESEKEAEIEAEEQEIRRDLFGTMQKVVVEGVEYLWDRKSRTQSAALLWRAMHDGTEMEGLSGSVLCLGEPTDPHCRAVLFKHFETPICPQHFEPSDGASARGDVAWGSIKGGFLLPWEIRNAEIICESDEWTAIPEDAQTWDMEFV